MNEQLMQHLHTSLMLVLWLSLPPLAVAAIVGLLVGLLQAVTQIQDQSLPQVIKLVAVLVTVAVAAPLLAAPLLRHSAQLFTEFPMLTR